MYYVIRWWMDGKPYEQTFDDLPQARAFLHQLDCHAELFAWLAGHEDASLLIPEKALDRGVFNPYNSSEPRR